MSPSVSPADFNHLPVGPQYRTTGKTLREADPLAAKAWFYAHNLACTFHLPRALLALAHLRFAYLVMLQVFGWLATA